jgi:TonB family protein
MSAVREFFSGGGIFMYILLLHLVVWFNLSWIYLVAVIVRALRIGSRAGRLEAACRSRDAAAAVKEADAKPDDRMGRVVAAAARGLLSEAPPERASAAARAEALALLPGLHPLWAVSCLWVLVCCIFVTALLGSLGEHFGLIQAFSALAYASPEDKISLLAYAVRLARYPVTFSIVILAVTGLPAVAAALLLVTAASSERERRRALELASALTGVQAAPVRRSTAGLAGAAFFILLLLVFSIALILPSGRLKRTVSQINELWARAPAKEKEPPAASRFVTITLPSPEKPGAKVSEKKEKKPAEGPAAAGSLPSQVINKVMLSHSNQIKFCYEKALGTSPDKQAKIVVRFTISPKGDVSSATVVSSTLEGSGVEDCVLRVIKHLKFPKPKGGGNVMVTYPYIFAHAK